MLLFVTGLLASWVECSPVTQETRVQPQVCVIPKTQKMVLDTSLLNTQQYKVHIEGKVEQSRERSRALYLHLAVVANKKEPFESPLTTVANFTYLFYSIIIITIFSIFHSNFNCTFICLSYLPIPPLGQDMTQGQFLNGV